MLSGSPGGGPCGWCWSIDAPGAGFMKTFFGSIGRRAFGTMDADAMLEFVPPPYRRKTMRDGG